MWKVDGGIKIEHAIGRRNFFYRRQRKLVKICIFWKSLIGFKIGPVCNSIVPQIWHLVISELFGYYSDIPNSNWETHISNRDSLYLLISVHSGPSVMIMPYLMVFDHMCQFNLDPKGSKGLFPLFCVWLSCGVYLIYTRRSNSGNFLPLLFSWFCLFWFDLIWFV